MSRFKILSLFDGISALQVAVNNIGIKDYEYYASEIDKYAIQVTQKNFPNTVQVGDVRNLKILHEISEPIKYCQGVNLNKDGFFFQCQDIDLLCGGSPCQDLSIAKKDRKGLDGERSSLFYEYVRILKEIKPKFFILENVASMPKEAKKTITKELFGIEPVLLNSALVSAQQRKRLFWVGSLQKDGTYKKVDISQPQDRGILLKDILESGLPYQEKSHSLTASYNGAVFWNSLEKKQRSMIVEPIIYSPYNQNLNKEQKAFSLGTNPHCQTAVAGQLVFNSIRVGHYGNGGQGDRIYSVQGKSVCLSTNGGGRGAKTGLYKIDLPDGDYTVRKLTPNECARLQGFPDDYHNGISNTQAYKCYGNSFTVPIIQHIIKIILK